MKKTLPSETRWEGDLPGTTLAAPPDIMERAERIVWMKKGKVGPFRCRPPRDFINDYLTQLRGRYGARPLRGIVRVPRIDDDGKIHFPLGYDAPTGLFHDRTLTFDLPPIHLLMLRAARWKAYCYFHFQSTSSMIQSRGGHCSSLPSSQRSNDHFCLSLRCLLCAVRCRGLAKV